MKSIRFAIAALILSSFALPTWASERYPTEQELSKLSRQFKQKLHSLKKSRMYQDRRTPTERQQVKSFVDVWSKLDSQTAPFLGMWTAIEESMSIYPSKTKGQVCIIETFLADQRLGVSFTTATVTNNGLRAGDKKVLIKEGNFLADTFVYEGKPGIYEYAHPRPLSNPAATDYLRNERKVVEQFNQAGCISSLPK